MFNKYAMKTARVWIQEYPWYNLPSSLHKVFIHGAEEERALLSIWELYEGAAQSNN